jgi:GNAT superfamily N-acetyltransferase
MAIAVRKAVPGDVPTIARLGRALARFHGDPTRFFLPAAVRRDGFGKSRQFHVLVAELRGRVVGYALFLDAYEPPYAARGIYLCDIYVLPRARRAGVGRALMAAIAAQAKRRRRTYVWWVSQRWNRDGQRFYRSLGAIAQPVVAHALVFDRFEALAVEGRPRSRTRRAR